MWLSHLAIRACIMFLKCASPLPAAEEAAIVGSEAEGTAPVI